MSFLQFYYDNSSSVILYYKFWGPLTSYPPSVVCLINSSSTLFFPTDNLNSVTAKEHPCKSNASHNMLKVTKLLLHRSQKLLGCWWADIVTYHLLLSLLACVLPGCFFFTHLLIPDIVCTWSHIQHTLSEVSSPVFLLSLAIEITKLQQLVLAVLINGSRASAPTKIKNYL